ncbi:MAG: hypothetical protein ACI9QC_000798 [Oceanicoccus sp.]|jgi:hypothetical protein
MNNRNKFIAGLVILLTALGLGGWQFSVMQTNKINANTLNTQVNTLAIQKATLIEDYQGIKLEVADERESSTQELSLVFPSEEDLTNLTRLFDDFATKNNFNSNPFFINSISYRSYENNEEGQYNYVPVSLNLESSKKNLTKFLEFIETSGSLEGEVRLMTVEELTLGYPAEYGGTYSATMDINAYFDVI